MNTTPKPNEADRPEKKGGNKAAGPVPTSLSEFLTTNKASARRFVQSISKQLALAEDDFERSCALVDSEPTKIGRVAELARAGADALPQPGMLLRWCERIVRSRDEALQNWALDPGQNASAAFGELLDWAYPLIRAKKDRAKRRTAEACLSIGLNLLMARRSLSPLDALRQLASASGKHSDRRSPASLERLISKQLRRTGAKQLFDLGRITALCDNEIAALEDVCRRASGIADGLRHEKDALENEQTTLVGKVHALSSDVDRRDRRIDELTAELEGARVRTHHELEKLRARFRREIGDRLAGLLADAWDAIDTNPPHPAVTRERLELARELIQGDMEWLTSSA